MGKLSFLLLAVIVSVVFPNVRFETSEAHLFYNIVLYILLSIIRR